MLKFEGYYLWDDIFLVNIRFCLLIIKVLKFLFIYLIVIIIFFGDWFFFLSCYDIIKNIFIFSDFISSSL